VDRLEKERETKRERASAATNWLISTVEMKHKLKLRGDKVFFAQLISRLRDTEKASKYNSFSSQKFE